MRKHVLCIILILFLFTNSVCTYADQLKKFVKIIDNVSKIIDYLNGPEDIKKDQDEPEWFISPPLNNSQYKYIIGKGQSYYLPAADYQAKTIIFNSVSQYKNKKNLITGTNKYKINRSRSYFNDYKGLEFVKKEIIISRETEGLLKDRLVYKIYLLARINTIPEKELEKPKFRLDFPCEISDLNLSPAQDITINSSIIKIDNETKCINIPAWYCNPPEENEEYIYKTGVGLSCITAGAEYLACEQIYDELALYFGTNYIIKDKNNFTPINSIKKIGIPQTVSKKIIQIDHGTTTSNIDNLVFLLVRIPKPKPEKDISANILAQVN